MKILFYQYGSICEPDIIDAMRTLDHEVVQMTNEIYNKAVTPQQTIELVSGALSDGSFSAVFSINFFPVIAEVCNIYRIRYICLSVDSPVMELFSHSISKEWNRIFLFDREQYNELHGYNPSYIFYMPLATNVGRWDAVLGSADSGKKAAYSADISFVGSLYTEKSPYDKVSGLSAYAKGYLEGIMEAQLNVYGYYFIENVLPDDIISEFASRHPSFYTPPEKSYLTRRQTLAQLYIGNKISALERIRCMETLSSRYDVDIYTGSDTSSFSRLRNHGFAKSHTEMPLIFNNSKINLNITSKAIRSGIPQRIWDILGCGGFCLTNYQSELMEYFVPDEHLVYYDSMEALMEKTEYYLSHDKERKDIAENGRELVHREHSYRLRVQLMLELAFSV